MKKFAAVFSAVLVASATTHVPFMGVGPTSISALPCDYNKLSSLPEESTVPAEYRDDIAFIKDVRKFGIEHLGLYACTQQYTAFKAAEESSLRYLLFVTKPTVLPSEKDAFSEFFEHNTIFREEVSAICLKSHQDTLEDELAYYTEEGYDVFAVRTTNYSIAGTSEGSPITPSLLKRSKDWQPNTVFHEMFHDSEKAWRGEFFSAEVGESLATLVGHAGAVEYFKARAGADSQDYQYALWSFFKYDEEAVKINAWYRKLQELYQSGKSETQKLQERKAIFAEAKEFLHEEVNNAKLWSMHPYAEHYPLMRQLHRSQGNNLQKTLKVIKDCPKEEEQALEYIQRIIKE